VRPLFPDGYKCETQGIVSVLSYGDENASDILGIIGISTALMLSDIPFNGPVSAVRVGLLNGELVSMPDLSESEELELNFVVAGTDEAVVMVEGGAREVSEDFVLKAIDFAHQEIKKINALQRDIASRCGKQKREFQVKGIDEALKTEIETFVKEPLTEAIKIHEKLKRQDAIKAVEEKVLERSTQKMRIAAAK
jgi:polyribonucleotide nucleotidyltransferase